MASDGVPARDAGLWAKEKLDFLDEFGPPALAATKKKRDRIFLDLFAGPGLNVVPETGEEFPGSPMRVATLTAPRDPRTHFTRGIFCNLDEDCHTALRQRLGALQADGRCVVPKMDCQLCDSNAAVEALLDTIDPAAYIFAFADIEGVQQLPWSTIQELRRRHRSVDLYVLVPVEMSFNRLTGMDPEHRARHADALTRYFGHDRWKPITDEWRTDAQGLRIRRELLDLYCDSLRAHWSHVEVVEVGRFGGNRLLYRMVFASNHPAGQRISTWAKRRERGAQGSLKLD